MFAVTGKTRIKINSSKATRNWKLKTQLGYIRSSEIDLAGMAWSWRISLRVNINLMAYNQSANESMTKIAAWHFTPYTE